MVDVGLLAAFVAGALSVLSPCVLPLLPLYLAHLAGVGPDGRLPGRRLVLAHASAFVIGFGLIFVLLGVSLGALGGVFLAYRPWLIRAGGAFMVVMGLDLIGLIQLPFLARPHSVPVPGAGVQGGRLSSSFLVGVGFAAGWMPCVDPILGAILTLAVSAAEPVRAGTLLAAYAAGLAVPFLVIAAALGVAACRQGARVRFLTAAGLVNELLEAQAAHRLSRYSQSLLRLYLLILDEVGLSPRLSWKRICSSACCRPCMSRSA